MNKMKVALTGSMILPQAPKHVTVQFPDGNKMNVPVSTLTNEQKDELAKHWRKSMDADGAPTYRDALKTPAGSSGKVTYPDGFPKTWSVDS